jgi:hypothetical protein
VAVVAVVDDDDVSFIFFRVFTPELGSGLLVKDEFTGNVVDTQYGEKMMNSLVKVAAEANEADAACIGEKTNGCFLSFSLLEYCLYGLSYILYGSRSVYNFCVSCLLCMLGSVVCTADIINIY